MGLFSSIGKLVKSAAPLVATAFGGPTAGALVSGGLGFLDARSQRKAAESSSQAQAYNQQALAQAQIDASRVDLGALVKEARENGFNPLTVLGATGGQNFASVAVPKLTRQSFANTAFSSAVTAFNSFNERVATREIDNLKRDILTEELSGLKDRNEKLRKGNFGYELTSNTTSRDDIGLPPTLESGKGTVTNPYSVGKREFVNPRNQDASSSEERNGEVGELVAGVSNIISDTVYNTRLKRIEKSHGRNTAVKVNEEFAKNDGRSLTDVIQDVVPKKPRTASPYDNWSPRGQ